MICHQKQCLSLLFVGIKELLELIICIICYCRCSSWKNPPLEKTLPFTGAQNLWLQISNSEGGAQKNGYYQDVP